MLSTGRPGTRALPVMIDAKPHPPGPVPLGVTRSPSGFLITFQGKGRKQATVTLEVGRFEGDLWTWV